MTMSLPNQLLSIANLLGKATLIRTLNIDLTLLCLWPFLLNDSIHWRQSPLKQMWATSLNCRSNFIVLAYEETEKEPSLINFGL